jgi:CheY-like chemotaxis protein
VVYPIVGMPPGVDTASIPREAMHDHLETNDVAPHLALVADPRPEAEPFYRSVLIPRRYVIDRADSGANALAKAVADPPDVVVLHTRTPVIDGFAVCQAASAYMN